jgi:hypothetical protein
MKLQRKSYRRGDRTTYQEHQLLNHRLAKDGTSIEFDAFTKDTLNNKKTMHRYVVTIEICEFQEMVTILSRTTKAPQTTDKISEALADSTRSLLRLLAKSSGLAKLSID